MRHEGPMKQAEFNRNYAILCREMQLRGLDVHEACAKSSYRHERSRKVCRKLDLFAWETNFPKTTKTRWNQQ